MVPVYWPIYSPAAASLFTATATASPTKLGTVVPVTVPHVLARRVAHVPSPAKYCCAVTAQLPSPAPGSITADERLLTWPPALLPVTTVWSPPVIAGRLPPVNDATVSDAGIPCGASA